MSTPSDSNAQTIPGWRHIYSGKVRDLYASDDAADTRILVVASDRVSAFDSVLSPGIPEKGALLTRLSRWWFSELADVPNHLAEGDIPAHVDAEGLTSVLYALIQGITVQAGAGATRAELERLVDTSMTLWPSA